MHSLRADARMLRPWQSPSSAWRCRALQSTEGRHEALCEFHIWTSPIRGAEQHNDQRAGAGRSCSRSEMFFKTSPVSDDCNSGTASMLTVRPRSCPCGSRHLRVANCLTRKSRWPQPQDHVSTCFRPPPPPRSSTWRAARVARARGAESTCLPGCSAPDWLERTQRAQRGGREARGTRGSAPTSGPKRPA